MTPAAPPADEGGWGLVALGFMMVAFVAVAWVAVDRTPPEWDHANHLERVVTCARDLERGDVRTLLERSAVYPPFAPCLAGVLYLLAPTDLAAAQAAMLLFVGAGMAAIFATGRALAGSTAGVVGAWIFGSAPFVVFLLLRFQLDLPLASMVAVTLAVLLATPGLDHRGWSVLLGVVIALGMLTKPPYPIYVAPAILIVLLARHRWRTLKNAVLAGVVAGVLALPWYGPRLFGLPAQFSARGFRQAAESGHAAAMSREALLFYPRWIWTEAGIVAVVLMLIGLVVGLARRHWPMLVTALVPLGLALAIQNKNMRYILPALPALAVLAGVGVATLPARARRVVLVIVAVVGAAQVSSTAFAVPPAVRLPVVDVPSVLGSPPRQADWHQRDLLRLIVQDRGGLAATVSVVPNDNYFSVSNFRYYATRDALPLRFLRPWEGEPLGIDYMLLKTGDQGPDFSEAKSLRVMQRLQQDSRLARAYPVIAEYPLPDGSTGILRARRLTQPVATAPGTLARRLEAALRQRLGEVARDVEGLEIRLAYDDVLALGRVERLEVRARAATVGELQKPNAATLRVQNLKLVVEDLLVNPYALEAGVLSLFDAGRLRVERLEVSAGDFQAFLAALKGFRRARVRFADGGVDIAIAQPGPDLSTRIRFVAAADRPLALAAERTQLGGVTLPPALVNWVVRNYDPTPRIAARLPFPVTVARVSVSERVLRVGD
jgi:hypothetical protein